MGKNRWSEIPGPIPYTTKVVAHAAATATEQWPIFRAPVACTVKKVTVVPQAAATGDNTNTTNLNIINKGSAGAGTTEIGNLDPVTGVNLVAFDDTNIPFNATYLVPGVTLAEGDTLTLQHEKVGTGLLIPELLVHIEYYPS